MAPTATGKVTRIYANQHGAFIRIDTDEPEPLDDYFRLRLNIRITRLCILWPWPQQPIAGLFSLELKVLPPRKLIRKVKGWSHILLWIGKPEDPLMINLPLERVNA